MATAEEIEHIQECETECVEAVRIREITLKDDVFSVGIKDRFYEDTARQKSYFVRNLEFRESVKNPEMLVFYESGEPDYLSISEHWQDKRAKPFYAKAFSEAETQVLEVVVR